MRYRTLLLSLSGAALALAIACSYGNYDGSYVAPDAGADGASTGEVVLTKTIDPAKQEVLTTPDGVFELTIPQGAFDAAVTITISRLTERTIESNLIVPVYMVAAPKEPALPVQAQFRGNNPNGSTNQALLIAQLGVDGAFHAAPLVSGAGVGAGGPGSFWALTRKLGTFSLVYATLSQSSTFSDITTASCLKECCSNGNGSFNAGAIDGSCLCNGAPGLECFLRACGNVAAAIDRCVEIGTAGAHPVACKNSAPVPGCNGGVCGYPSTPCSPSTGGTCCIANHAGQCIGNAGGPGGNTCLGIAIRCDLDTKCPGGTKCCVFDDEAYCASTCPNERTWCRSNADCDGGAGDAGDAGPCFEARGCPHGTCGTPPTACTN